MNAGTIGSLISSSSFYRSGDDVIMVGHPVFDSVHNMGLSMTEGVVASVITIGHTPVMIQVSDIYPTSIFLYCVLPNCSH